MGAHNRTEMLRLRGVLLTTLRLLGLRARLLSILAVYKRRFTGTGASFLSFGSFLPHRAVPGGFVVKLFSSFLSLASPIQQPRMRPIHTCLHHRQLAARPHRSRPRSARQCLQLVRHLLQLGLQLGPSPDLVLPRPLDRRVHLPLRVILAHERRLGRVR